MARGRTSRRRAHLFQPRTGETNYLACCGSHSVILARHRVHLRYALDLQETLRRLVHLPALHIDQNQGGYHTATPCRGSVQTATTDTCDTSATNDTNDTSDTRNYLSAWLGL